jgi:hypothetical protein
MELSQVLSEHARISRELGDLHRELAECLVAERQAKFQAYQASSETSFAGRERTGELHSLPLTCDILRLKGEIAALTEEKEFLRLVLTEAADAERAT